MTPLPSGQCRCGQPWEAHQLRCPRPKRPRVGGIIALAIAGGVVLQVLFVLALAVVVAGVTRPTTILALNHPLRRATSGPTQPRVRACEEFYALKRTHNPNLLNHAVTDSHGSRVPSRFAPRFRADLTGLRDSARVSAHSPAAIGSERAVQHHCKLLIGGTPHWSAHFRKAVAQFSRPGGATAWSAPPKQPGTPSSYSGAG